MENLCINGEAITNSYHDNNPVGYGPDKAFDRDDNTCYCSHSYTEQNKPYIVYHFEKPVKVSKMLLRQGCDVGQYGKNIYVIYSDDGINYIEAEYITDLINNGYNSDNPYPSEIILKKDYGEHEYWGLQLKENVSGGPAPYPWTVLELEMHGFETIVSPKVKNSVKNTIVNHPLIQKHCFVTDIEE